MPGIMLTNIDSYTSWLEQELARSKPLACEHSKTVALLLEFVIRMCPCNLYIILTSLR